MCGPADDEKQKARREEFLEEFSSACAETICEHISIFSLSASSSIFDGRQQSVSVPARPRSRRNGKNKNHQSKWIH
jgi:hypothetical protein